MKIESSAIPHDVTSQTLGARLFLRDMVPVPL